MTKVYVGDIGTEIILDTLVDITSATSVSIKARKPDGSAVTWPGAVYGGTSIRYVSQLNDLDMDGVWSLQGHVTSPAWSGSSEIVELRVHPLV